MNNGVNNINNNQQPQLINSTPVVNNIQPTQPQMTNQIQVEKKRKKHSLLPVLLIIFILLIGYIFYMTNNYNQTISNLKYNCTPISSSKEKKLDINSTLVQDLYSKVQTSIREDIANPELDDNLKLYLAYRQILEKDKYDSNCNLFDTNKMEPYTCVVKNFTPKAFKEETLKKEIVKLFGEHAEIPLNNIQLSNSCIVGYQYIAERGEFVEGYCNKQNAILFKATKTLKSATSTGNTIILLEDVKYKANEKQDVPSYLKNGTYKYVFRLDMNYNYILVSKEYQSKY